MAMIAAKLRIGLILYDWHIAAWELRLIEIIRKCDYAEISLVILSSPGSQDTAPSKPGRMLESSKAEMLLVQLLDSALAAIERRLVGKPGEIPNAFKRVDAGKVAADVAVLEIVPEIQQSNCHIRDDDLAKIRESNLDVLIQLGFKTFHGKVLQAARYGVWSIHTGNDPDDCPSVAGYMEVMESSPETLSMLLVRTGDISDAQVICSSYSSTNIASLEDNASRMQWKSLRFIPRMLEDLHTSGEKAFLAKINERNACPRFYDRKIHKRPTKGERVALLWGKLKEALIRKWNHWFYFDQWILMYDIKDGVSTHLGHFKHIAPPKDRFWADPFVIARNDKFYVFYEELVYAENKGRIAVLVIDKQGNIESRLPVLETPYHLSYPFLFEFEDDLYMIPESKQNRTVELYKCTEFPHQWEFQKNLMEACMATDATLVEHQGKWWLFVSQVETEGASTWDELFLYYSDSPLSTHWNPHPLNPVVSDVRSARPAGQLFRRHGRLFRPSQNSSGHYGYGFNICEVIKMTETDYEERVVEQVEPKWDKNIISTHTFNYAGGMTVIDGQLRRRR